jgi:hypothetical protein
MASRFSDQQIIIILQKAARRVNRILCLFNTDEEIVIDTSGNIITPDDGALEDLVLLQAECLLAKRDFTEAVNEDSEGLLIVDGEQRVDARGRAIARGTFFDSPYSPCAELKDALKLEKMKRDLIGGVGGKMVW